MCGDGATSEGDFHEALNFAAVWQAPVVFFVQNNGYAISVPLAKQTAAPVAGPQGHRLRHARRAGRRQRRRRGATRPCWARRCDRARDGGGPTLVEALTYRIEAHTNADDATRYRDDAEVEAWRARDPLARLRAVPARGRGLLDERAGRRGRQPRPRPWPPTCAAG